MPAVAFPVRRMGSSVVHLIDPLGLDVYSARHFGAHFYGVTAPAAAVCGAVLRVGPLGGALVWMREGEPTCRACAAVARVHPFRVWSAPAEGELEPLIELLEDAEREIGL